MSAAQGSGAQPARLIVYQLLGEFRTYSPVAYRVEGSERELESCFSSFAIADHYASSRGVNDCEVRFFAPLSLTAPRAYPDGHLDLEAFRDEVENALRQREPNVRWRVEVVPLPTFGSYRLGEETWTFRATPDSVAAAALADMIESTRLLTDRGQRVSVVLNVSTGLNSYIPSLIEALRALLVLDSALSLGEGGVVCEARYAAVDPLPRDRRPVLNVYLLETSAKFFIDFPFKSKSSVEYGCTLSKLFRESEGQLPEQLSGEARQVLKRVESVLIEGLKAFNAFRYGAPLALLDRRLIELDQQAALECAQDLSELMARALTPTVSGRTVTVPDVSFALLRSLLTSLAITASIALKVSELGIGATQEGAPLEVLVKFAELYERFPELRINSRLLTRELQDLELVQSVASTVWEPLRALHEREDLKKLVKNVRYGSDEKRNFYAHAGLSRNEVEVKGDGGRLVLRYSEKRLDAIESWLFKPD